MGRITLALFWVYFIPFSICAQDASRATVEVMYRVTCIDDTVKKEVLADTFYLRYNDTRSLFYESDTFFKDSLRHNDIGKWSDMMSNSLTRHYPKDKAFKEYYVHTDYEQGIYTYQDGIFVDKYRYRDSLPNFNWEILPEYKMLGEYRCQKAVGTYMGRQYETWFSPEMPVKAGPWKFYGLPGLIMEAYDTKHLYSFTFCGMHSCSGEMALFPSRYFKTTKEKFLTELSLYLKDPIDYQANKSLTKITYGNTSGDLEMTTELRNSCRHQPMELLK